HAFAHQLLGQLATIPLRQRTSEFIRSLAGHFDHMESDVGGERRACARVVVDPPGQLSPCRGSAAPTCGRYGQSCRRGALRWSSRFAGPAPGADGLAARILPGRWSIVANVPTRRVVRQSVERQSWSCGPAWRPRGCVVYHLAMSIKAITSKSCAAVKQLRIQTPFFAGLYLGTKSN